MEGVKQGRLIIVLLQLLIRFKRPTNRTKNRQRKIVKYTNIDYKYKFISGKCKCNTIEVAV